MSAFIDSGAVLANVLSVIGNTSLLPLLGARLLFNMKEAGAKGLNQGMSCGLMSTVSGIDFAFPQDGTELSQEEVRVKSEVVTIREV